MRLILFAMLSGCCDNTSDPVVDSALADSRQDCGIPPPQDTCPYWEDQVRDEQDADQCMIRWTPGRGYPWGLAAHGHLTWDGDVHALASPTWHLADGTKGVLLVRPDGCAWELCL